LNYYKNISGERISDILFYTVLLAIFYTSFLLFSPLFLPEFGSDHAIHVLMSVRNDYPEGIYFWGQNRLGSLLPEVTSWLLKVFPIYPITAISVVNHLFLMTSYFLLQSLFELRSSKIAVAFTLFFPLYTFTALLHISHPYCPQLFTGIAGLFLLAKSYHLALEKNSFLHWKIVVTGIGGSFLTGVSLWVSETSVLFFVFAGFYFLLEKEKRNAFFAIVKNQLGKGIILFSALVIPVIFWILKIKQYKNYYPENELYDQVFIRKTDEISSQWGWMKEKLLNHLFFANEEYTSGIFSWFIIIAFLFFLIFYPKKKSAITSALLLSMLVGAVALFFSTWNFRSQFEPRYYAILYPFLVVWVLIKSEIVFATRKFITGTTGVFISLLLFMHNYHFISDRKPGVVERFSGFADLEPGGMIGNYWQVYRACAISPYTLKGIAKEGDPLRNDFMLEEVMNEKIIYVIKTDFYPDERAMPDTLVQYGYRLVKTSDKEEVIGYVVFEKYRVLSGK
jgi:hypothetical protein